MAYLLKASIVIAVFFCIYAVFLKRETFFQQNRWFLLLGLLVATTLPLVVIPIEVRVEPVNVNESFTVVETPTVIDQTEPAEQSINWLSLLSLLYGLGLLFFIGQFLLQFGSLVLLLLKNPKLKDGIYTYVIVKNNISPFSFFKWIVYNPEQMDNEEVQLMLTHEKVHVNQLHSIDIILSQLACTLFWFNPLMWLYRNYIRQNLEYIADYETQFASTDSKIYQKLLLKTSIANQHELLTTNFYNSLIKERIVMLQKSRSQTKKQWRYFLILPLLGVVLLSMNTKEVYVEKEPTEKVETSTTYQNPEIEIIFTKSTSDTQLDEIEDELKANDISMKIKTLERNDQGLITSIDVDFKTPNGSANYAVIKEDGISDFYFRTSKDGSFGVGALKNRKKYIVKDIKAGFTDSDNTHKIIIEEDNNVKIVDGKSVKLKENDDTEIIIEIDSLTQGKSWTDDNSFSYQLNSLVDTIYVKQDVHVIKAPGNKFEYKIGDVKKEEDYDIKFIERNSGKRPLFIINGEEKDESTFKNLGSKNIKSMTVLKDESAMALYGEKGKNGVIKIETIEPIDDKQKSKWIVRTEVNSISFTDDEDGSKNATLAYISKYTPDDILDKNKALLEQVGLKVKYSKIRRNKKGEITRIKISIEDGKGAESSATWKNDDGIPGLEYGKSEDVLIARTSKQSFSKN